MLELSTLSHTWILDIDGTLLKHNGHLDNQDVILPGVKEFFAKIPSADKIILLTARKKQYQAETIRFLTQAGLRWDEIIFDIPTGERILINDMKPRERLKTAIAINVERDVGLGSVAIKPEG